MESIRQGCARKPHLGNIVIAMINGAEAVTKYLRQKGKVILRSANPQYTDIETKETDQFSIADVVFRIVEV